MSNASYLFTIDAVRSAARGSVRRPERDGVWQRLVGAWRVLRQRRLEAQELEALQELDTHLLRDIGASDETIARAAYLRERREHPFERNSPRGIDVASRRMNW